jgi:uncharacterized repeat protein (TIGR03803 family)
VSFYRLSTNGNFTTLYTRSNSLAPARELAFGSDGLLYGAIGASSMTPFAGPKPGSIFRITTAGVFSNLFTFNATNGFDPQERLLLTTDGSLYGTTDGDAFRGNSGTIFHLSTNGELTTLMIFQGYEIAPTSPLVQANDGNLYGTGSTFGTPYSGIVFRLVPSTAISALSISNGVTSVTWNSFTNGVYRVEYKSSLADLDWMPLGPTVTATGSTTTAPDYAADSERSYRVVLLP